LQKNRGVEVFGAQFRGQAQLPGQAGVAPGVLVGQETVAEILASVEIGDPRRARMTISAPGRTRRISRSAGIAITASPSQFVDRTRIFITESAVRNSV
jgi:hypothetical protein